jgi:hypothetical protein
MEPKKPRTREIICEYQPYILNPPVAPAQLRADAVSGDGPTVERWKETWLNNIRANKKKFGSFKENSLGSLFNKYLHRPVIIAGSGPSLQHNVDKLKDRNGIPLLSCLHNFHYFEDKGINPEYYVSLDAGPIVLEEVSEGGSKTEDEYWAMTKDRTLLAFIGSDPRLFEKWQGPVYLFNAPVPDPDYENQVDDIEMFRCSVSTGGNVLGACLYIGKGYLGASSIIFVGADFSFDPANNRFHGWDSKYDKSMGYTVPIFDIFGNKVKTWQSYKNFAQFFNWVSVQVPGFYINCSEGGCLGSYAEGNLYNIRQMDLEDCLKMYNMSNHLRDQALNPDTAIKKILF